ncbi:MAG: hypothetical protein ACXABY_24120 [Candidatus Thorarchaeota archaeon]|jgi:hypothetical protein
MPEIQAKKNTQPIRGQSNVPRHDKALMEAGEYEVTKSTTFTIEIPLAKRENESGKILWAVVTEEYADTTEEVVFRMWSYNEMIQLRKLATKYDQLRRVHMIDHDELNRLKIQRLMQSWTLDANNPRLELHHLNGVLSDETWEKVTRVQPTILRYIIEKMNERYEYGG